MHRHARTILLLAPAAMLAAACVARDPSADSFAEWETDNTPWDAPPSECVAADGIDGATCDTWTDGLTDGVPDSVPDYPTEFDVADTEYEADIPESDGTVPVRPCEVTFSYTPGAAISSVAIAGEFNGWSVTASPLSDADGDGTWTASLDLAEGEYAYKLVTNGSSWIRDPANPWTKYSCSGACTLNSNLRVPDCNRPYLALLSYEAKGDGSITGRVQYVDGNPASGPKASSVLVERNGAAAPFAFDAATGVVSFSWTGLAAGKYMTRVRAEATDGQAAEDLFVPGWVESQPWDWRDALIYFAFTDRFLDGNRANNGAIGVEQQADFRGGDFKGIQQKIDDGYFAAMGANVLWISPPYENPAASGVGSDGHMYSGYHGYWPADPLAAETTWGGDADLDELLATAHAHGIRVIMDSVLNHVHSEHPYWAAHRADGWFHGSGDCVCGRGSCDWDSHRIDCWFTSYLPDIDYQKHDALVTMVGDTLDWIFGVGFDGLRVDAVKHFEHIVGQRLALEMRERFEPGGQPFYMVGETFTGGYGGTCGGGPDFIMQYISPIELDGQFDFPLFWVILDVFAKESADYNWLASAVDGLARCYGSFPVMSPFLGNHDVARFVSVANGNETGNPWGNPPPVPSGDGPYARLRLAFVFLLTLAGAPLVYYGDEIGLPGGADPDNRRMMKFTGLSGSEQAVLDTVKKAGTARKEHAALRRGGRATLHVDANFYVFARGTGADAVIVALNRNGFPVTSSPLSLTSIGVGAGTAFTDVMAGGSATVNGSGQLVLTVPAKSGAIYVQ